MITYSVKELSRLAGVTPRTLRHYDKIGLLSPKRQGTGEYRSYSTKDVDRLQEILLFRELGMELSEIKEMLNDPKINREARLSTHLNQLHKKKADLNILISNVEDTIRAEKGELKMNDDKKFEGLKKQMIEENEEKYGEEIRAKYGDQNVDESNRKMMNLSKEEYDEMNDLSAEINSKLESAVKNSLSPNSDEALKIAELHKKWLGYSWSQYNPEAHKGLVEMYIADERFKKYYDGNIEGCAKFLRDAVMSMIDG